MTIRHKNDPWLDDGNIGWFWALSAAGIATLLLVAITLSDRDCKSLRDGQARLACYDAAADTQPAKGASAITH